MKNYSNLIMKIFFSFLIALSFALPNSALADEDETTEEKTYNWCFVVRSCEGCIIALRGGKINVEEYKRFGPDLHRMITDQLVYVTAHATIGWQNIQYSVHKTNIDIEFNSFPTGKFCFKSKNDRHNIETYVHRNGPVHEKILCERKLDVAHGTWNIDIKVPDRYINKHNESKIDLSCSVSK